MMPPSRNVIMITLSTLTPMRRAVSWSWATERMPRPRRVRFTNRSSATIMSKAPMITMIWSTRTSASKKLNTRRRSSMRGYCSKLRPRHQAKPSAMASDAPIAEIKNASRVA
jgi:hypothetical protein